MVRLPPATDLIDLVLSVVSQASWRPRRRERPRPRALDRLGRAALCPPRAARIPRGELVGGGARRDGPW